jgi:hypothetical protein
LARRLASLLNGRNRFGGNEQMRHHADGNTNANEYSNK